MSAGSRKNPASMSYGYKNWTVEELCKGVFMTSTAGEICPAIFLVSYEYRTDSTKWTSESRRILALNGDGRRASKLAQLAVKQKMKLDEFEFRVTGIQHVTDVEVLDSKEK